MTTDRETAEVIRVWMKEEVPLDDAGIHRVLARLPDIPQRRHRWLWPLDWRPFASDATRDAGVHGVRMTDHRPGSMSDTTDRLPTATGRTRLMFSPVKAIVGGALVFAIGGVFLIAQPFGQQGDSVPAAAPVVEQTEAVRVTAAQACAWDFPDGIQTGTCTITASDPRLTGTAIITQREIVNAAGGDNEIETYDEVLHGPEGTWTGRHYVVFDRGAYTAYPLVILSGDGAYEGWTYVAAGAASPPDGNGDFVGALYQGPPPATWEMPIAPSQ